MKVPDMMSQIAMKEPYLMIQILIIIVIQQLNYVQILLKKTINKEYLDNGDIKAVLTTDCYFKIANYRRPSYWGYDIYQPILYNKCKIEGCGIKCYNVSYMSFSIKCSVDNFELDTINNIVKTHTIYTISGPQSYVDYQLQSQYDFDLADLILTVGYNLADYNMYNLLNS